MIPALVALAALSLVLAFICFVQHGLLRLAKFERDQMRRLSANQLDYQAQAVCGAALGWGMEMGALSRQLDVARGDASLLSQAKRRVQYLAGRLAAHGDDP